MPRQPPKKVTQPRKPGGMQKKMGPGTGPGKPPSAPAPSPQSSPEAVSAKATIKATLDAYGLGALGDWAWGQYLNGVPSEQIMLDLRARPEYSNRFPGMAELSKNGQAISEAEYINLERSYTQQARAWGIPEGFYDDPSDFAKLIGGNVSAQEWGERLQMGMEVTLSSPRAAAMRDYLAREEGMTNALGLTLAFWIDPDQGTDILKRRYVAAQIAAESALTGFGSLNKSQAERVADAGITTDAARQGFSKLAALDSLRTSLVGDAGSQGVSQDDMVNVLTGDAKAEEKLRREQERRVGAFQGGGGFAAGQKGVSGLGSAAT